MCQFQISFFAFPIDIKNEIAILVWKRSPSSRDEVFDFLFEVKHFAWDLENGDVTR